MCLFFQMLPNHIATHLDREQYLAGSFVWAYEGIGPLTARAEVSSFWAAASFALCVVSLAFIALVLWVAKQRRL
jgi:hypothetical protein